MGEQVIELGGALADQMREHLPLLLTRQVRARRWCREIELRRVARMLGHDLVTTGKIKRSPAPLGLPAAVAVVKSIVRRPLLSAAPLAAQPCGPALSVDHRSADQDVMQQPPPMVEEGHQQDQWRKI